MVSHYVIALRGLVYSYIIGSCVSSAVRWLFVSFSHFIFLI